MKWARGLFFHGALLVIAAVVAMAVWTKSEQPTKITGEQVRVWDGSPDDVDSIEFSSKDTKLSIEARKDTLGRWYVCTLDKTVTEPAPEDSTSSARPSASSSAGAASATPPTPPPPPKPKMVTHHQHQVFVSVSGAEGLVKSLAPLEAFRKIGKIDPKELSDFGLDKPKGTLRISIGGKTHSLVLGGETPGGGDRYAKDLDDGQVYAIPGEIAWNLLFAESRLVERELHKWRMNDVQRIIVSNGHAMREVVRVPKKVGAWADPKTPSKVDETMGNWLSKLEQLRVMQYVEKPKLAPADLIVRLTFYNKTDKLGTLELWKGASQKNKMPVYLVRTEYTRWYASVLHSTAAQIAQDVNEVVK
jgi:Domain of unknown function (DUF4340)